PDSTELYFVARGDGTHIFTKSWAAHLAAIAHVRAVAKVESTPRLAGPLMQGPVFRAVPDSALPALRAEAVSAPSGRAGVLSAPAGRAAVASAPAGRAAVVSAPQTPAKRAEVVSAPKKGTGAPSSAPSGATKRATTRRKAVTKK